MSATGLTIWLRKNGQASRKPSWDLRYELSPVSYSFADFPHDPEQLRCASIPYR